MRILHFAPDEKFIPFIQETFEAVFPAASQFRIATEGSSRLRFVQPGENVRAIGAGYWRGDDFQTDLASCDILIIHYLTAEFAALVPKVPERVLLGWIGWGGDFYCLFEKQFGDMLLPETRRATAKPSYRLGSVCGRIAGQLNTGGPSVALAWGKLKDSFFATSQAQTIRSISSRLDFVWVNPEEQAMFRAEVPDFKGPFHRIGYYSAESVFELGPPHMDGPDILVGNSATPTNNHLEIFDQLCRLDLEGRQIVVPLSYGDLHYQKLVIKAGKKRFGSRFSPITAYVPLEEYNLMLRRCGTVVMNHVRQQAGTSVATALYKGAKVYLRDENTVAQLYRHLGSRIYSIQTELVPGSEIFGPVEVPEMERNRDLLREYWGHASVLGDIRALAGMADIKRSAFVD